MWYRTHESELENGFYHADNAGAHASSMYVVFYHKEKHSRIIVYEMYRLPNVLLTLMLINLRARFEQIAFVRKRIVPQG